METKIQFIRNATMKIQYAGKTFLTDPMFSDKETLLGFLNFNKFANPTTKLPLSVEEILEGIECIIVSHSHIPAEHVDSGPSDHFDSVAINKIDKDIPIYIQHYDVAGIKRMGFGNVTAIYDSITLDGIKVTRFNGIHSNIDAFSPMVGEVSGYIFESKGCPTMLWTGDALLTEEVKQVISTYQPDIIITHSGGAQMLIDEKGSIAKLVMDDEDTIEIAKLVPNAKIVAIHMEALDHCPVTRKDLREKANAAGISKHRLIIPNDGETIIL